MLSCRVAHSFQAILNVCNVLCRTYKALEGHSEFTFGLLDHQPCLFASTLSCTPCPEAATDRK